MRRARLAHFRIAAQFALLTAVSLGASHGTPLLSLQTTTSTFLPNDTVTLSVNATGMSDLYAIQFDLGFIPGVLAAETINEGAFLKQGGPTIFVPGRIDNSTGTIQMTIDTRLGSVPGVSGGGSLAEVSFLALQTGTSPVTLSRFILLDSHLSEIVTDNTGTTITVVPEPNLYPILGLMIAIRRFTYGRTRSENKPG
jgi:hypothetical protein